MEVLPVMIVFVVLVCFSCDAATDPQEVMSLQEMYRALNFSPQLVGWKAENGDPCGETWTGISCSGSSVLNIDLHGLALGGYLGGQLSNLHHLKTLDVSGNSITGEIPVSLPPNASHINLSANKFVRSIPHSLTSLKSLRHLNLSHNMLSGPMGNVFTGLFSLREMDLSYNNFTGDLPDSVSSLKNLTKLYLQNNNFTGSVILLADLQLTDLIGGNNFHTFPLDNVTAGQNISSYPIAQSNAIENYPPLKIHMHKKKALGSGGIVVLILATCTAFIISFHINQARKRQHLSSLLDTIRAASRFPLLFWAVLALGFMPTGQDQPQPSPHPQPQPDSNTTSFCNSNSDIFSMRMAWTYLGLFTLYGVVALGLKTADRFFTGMIDMVVYIIRRYYNALEDDRDKGKAKEADKRV